MKKYMTMGELSHRFQNFIFKDKILELCCYNPDTGDYIVIEDGLCPDYGDGWNYFWYVFKDKEKGLEHFLSEVKHPNDKNISSVTAGRLKF